MKYYVKDLSTGRVVLIDERTHKVLGGNYVKVKAPAKKQQDNVFDQPKKEPVQEPIVEPQVEETPDLETKEDYLEAIRATGMKKKGLHLFSLDKLKEIYEGTK